MADMSNAHLITCQSTTDYSTFITNGFAGLYPITVEPNNTEQNNSGNERKLAAKIGTNWDVIADLKRVKSGDVVFLHVRNDKIYGPFLSTSHFLESPTIPGVFKSVNLRIEYWIEHYDEPNFVDPYPWRIGIKSIDDVTFENGFNSMELFKRKTVGSIHTIPERFLYHDKPKIVKPLLNHEAEIIRNILSKVSPKMPLSFLSNPLEGYEPITLNLRPYNGGEVYREKILEAWLMENVTFNGDNRCEYDNIKQIFGEVNHFVNSIYTYYTNFMDVLFYNESLTPVNEYCNICGKYTSQNKTHISVIELKKGVVDLGTMQQLREYGDWALHALANNDTTKIKMHAIGATFNEDVMEIRDIALIRYTLHDERPFLRLEKIN
jgi:hypothetical protein